MKNCTGLASVGYRDSTELVLQWWHSLGASDCTVLDGISKLFYISENELRIKTQSIELQRLVSLFIFISDIFTVQSMVLHEHVLCVLCMHVCKLLYYYLLCV